jgi:SRSO17 transposase
MQLDTSIAAFLCLLETLRPVFTQPSFMNFVTITMGWLLTPGRHAVTAALVVTGVSQERHHSAFHRFFSLARWKPDEIGRRLFGLIVRLAPDDEPVPAILDDTLTPKKGDQIYGIGSHVDPVRSTKKYRILCFGHVWVVLCVAIQFPFCRRPWALPVLLRLYRNKSTCEKKKQRYKKKTELAREMLDVFATWLDGDRRVELVADAAYCNSTVTKGLRKNIVLFGSMRPDAALTALPTARDNKRGGRPRVRGRRLPTPEKVFKTARYGWYANQIWMYRSERWVTYQEWKAQWYRACGGQLLKIVLVDTEKGRVPFRVFFCTDPEVSAEYLLRRYSWRWSIEVTFYDLKQFLGFSDSQAWTRRAVERTAPFVAFLFTLVVVWYANSARGSKLYTYPVRPWYPNKVTPSFADMLGAAQRAAILSGVFDPASNTNNLHNPALLVGSRRVASILGGG